MADSRKILDATLSKPMRFFRKLLSPAIVLWVGVVPLAASLRLLFLYRRSLWQNELFSIAVARLPRGEFVRLLSHTEANMALYYALLRVWLRLGDSETFLRIPSLIFSLLTTLIVYLLGRRLYGARAGLVAAFLTAVNVLHVHFSLEVRSYSLLVLLAAASSLYFIEGVTRPSSRHWILYTATTTLAIYSHFFGAWMMATHWGSLALLRRRQVPWKQLIASTTAICLLCLPLALFVLLRGQGQFHLYWVPKIGVGPVAQFFLYAAGASWPLLVAHFVFGSVAVLLLLRTLLTRGAGLEAWQQGFGLAWLFVPVILIAALSLRTPMFHFRFLLFCLPGLILLSAAGLSQLRPGWPLAAALLLITLLSAQSIRHYHQLGLDPGQPMTQEQDWQGASRYLLAHAQKTDAAIFYPWTVWLPFDYYLNTIGFGRGPEVLFPKSWVDVALSPGSAAGENQPDATVLEAIAARYRRVWFAFVLSEPSRPELALRRGLLSARYACVEVRRFDGLVLELYSPGATRSLRHSEVSRHLAARRLERGWEPMPTHGR